MNTIKKPTYSYSRLSTYKSCPFQYYLRYIQKKFLGTESLNTLLGTLLHSVEEKISLSLMEEKSPNYADLINYLHSVNIPKANAFDTEGGIYGIDILKKRFFDEWYRPSEKTGLSYKQKVDDYIERIDRQEKFMLAHPELKLFDVEREFLFSYNGEQMKGFIDRVLKYKNQNRYIIHDIKTRDRLFDSQDTTTPLQAVVYSLALTEQLKLEEEPDEFFYDLIMIDQLQPAGTKGFIKRGKTALDKIFAGIHNELFTPRPSPLCYWCDYCNNNPNITPEGKNLCPYYSLWTPEHSSFAKNMEWEGMYKLEEHRQIMKGESHESQSNKWDGFVL